MLSSRAGPQENKNEDTVTWMLQMRARSSLPPQQRNDERQRQCRVQQKVKLRRRVRGEPPSPTIRAHSVPTSVLLFFTRHSTKCTTACSRAPTAVACWCTATSYRDLQSALKGEWRSNGRTRIDFIIDCWTAAHGAIPPASGEQGCSCSLD